jgi:ankyrin repeat protein
MVLPLFLLCWHQRINHSKHHLDSNLMEAARIGDYLDVEKYLEKGASVNSKDTNGMTPLIWAALQGHEEVAHILLQRGGDLEAKNDNGDTALMWASVMGHKDVVELLLDHGANADLSEPNSGVTALMAAAAKGHADVAQALVEKGAIIDAKDRNGNTALMHASIRGYGEVVELLVAAGATFNGARPKAVATAIIFVSDDGRPAGIEVLRMGPNSDVTPDSGRRIPVTDAYLKEAPQTDDWCYTASTTTGAADVVPAVITTMSRRVEFFTH